MIKYNIYIQYIEKQDEGFLESFMLFYNVYSSKDVKLFFDHPFIESTLKQSILKKIQLESMKCSKFLTYLINKNHMYLLSKIIKEIEYKHKKNEIIYKDGLIAYKNNLILDLSLNNVLNFLRNQL